MPFAWDAPPKGLAFHRVPMCAFLYCLSCHRWDFRCVANFLAVLRPAGLPFAITHVWTADHNDLGQKRLKQPLAR